MSEEVTVVENQEGVNAAVDTKDTTVVMNPGPVTIDVSDDGASPTADPPAKAETTVDTGSDIQTSYNKGQDAQKALKDDLTKRGADFDSYYKEFVDKGSLSDESYEALEKVGYPRQVIDAFISGQQATEERLANSVIETAGGKEEFVKLAEFAKGQGQATVDTWNRVVNSGDLGSINMMLKGVRADYVAKYGTSNPTIMGKAGVPAKTQGFATTAEMVTAMSDKRYGRDREYTHGVEAKVKNSNLFA